MTSSSMFEGSPSNLQNGQKRKKMSKHNNIAFGDIKMLEQIHQIH